MLECIKEVASFSYFDVALEEPLKDCTFRYPVYIHKNPKSIVDDLDHFIVHVLNSEMFLH